MRFLNWALRLFLAIYAGYLIDSSYFGQLQTPLGRFMLVACLLLYLAWFYRWETSAVGLLVFLVPLSSFFPRLFGWSLPPLHVLFTSAFILAIAVAPLVRVVRQRFPAGPFGRRGLAVPDTLMAPARDRLEFFFTLFTGTWIAFCIVSFVFVSLRYTNLYPFFGEPPYDYVINRLGHRSSEGILISHWTMASYVNSAVFLLYAMKSRHISGAIPSRYLNPLFAAYSCVGVVAYLQSHYNLAFLNAGGIWPATARLNATFDDPNALACSLILVFPIATLGTLYLSGIGRILALLATGSSIYLLYVAASRTAFAGLVLGLVVVALFLGLQALRKRRYALLVILVLLGVTVLAGSIVLLEKGSREVLLVARAGEMWDFLKQNWTQGTGFSDIGKVAYSRNLWWPSAVRMFKEHPLTGVGIGAFQFETVNHGAPFDSAGNQYLQLLAESGIWGLVFGGGIAVALIYCLGILLVKTRPGSFRDYLWTTALGAALIAFSISLHFGSHLLFHQVAFVFALVLGSLLRIPGESGGGRQTIGVSWRWTAAPATVAMVFLIAQLTALSHSAPVDFRKEVIGKEQDIFGYPPEKWAGGFEFRWLTSLNWKRIRLDQPVLNYSLYTGNPDVSSTGVTVSFFLDNRPLKTVKLTDHNWSRHSIEIPPNMVGKDAVLKVTVDRTWRAPRDPRQLGVALREVEAAATRP
ncbi:MAG: O-antigen ligase family protein [Acidobacteria bacterium]|nr:MAG: O-antigen ligase family protein [Acidobacteriota bacterium]